MFMANAREKKKEKIKISKRQLLAKLQKIKKKIT